MAGIVLARRMRSRVHRWVAWLALAGSFVLTGNAAGAVALEPANTVPGYIARLLINEVPFPGEHAWVSEEDSKAAMLAILCVLDSRISHIPSGYRQQEIASEVCTDIIAVITAGGEKGQCDGFYRDASGKFVAVARVHERIDYLLQCANKGAPGRFARLLEHAQGLADAYVREGMQGVDRFAGIADVDGVAVTGRAYSWMTDTGGYHPGGNFVRIPDEASGTMGGNRFFTLRKLK